MKKIARPCPPSLAALRRIRAGATVVSPIIRPGGVVFDPEPAPWIPVYVPVGILH